MLVIRAQQMEALSRVALDGFETEMVAHCNDFSPEFCESVGEAQLRAAIRQAIAQSSEYEFTQRGPVRFFIEMTLLFGCAFDTDPQYEWANKILITGDSSSQMQRAERLYEETLDYLEKVNGSEDAFHLLALERISDMVRLSSTFSTEDFIPGLLRQIAHAYPQKAEYAGNAALEVLFRKGTDEAAVRDLTTGHGQALVCILMFVFGHECIDDPLHQWIRQTLEDENITNRDRHLENKMLERLDRLIAWHKEGA